jgi:hypothetical protein
MKTTVTILGVLLASPLLWAQGPEVILVGTMHEMHLRESLHYSMPDMAKEVETLKPGLICGEITPEAYGHPMEGYFPPEAAYLAVLAPSFNARFVAADWRISYQRQHSAEHKEPRNKVREASVLDKRQLDGMLHFAGDSVFDYLHSEAYIGLSEQKFEDILGENTISDIAAGGWHERNRRIVENCLAQADSAHRIVIVFGANHLSQLRRQLAARGITARIASRQFIPAGQGTVPPEVIARWERNYDNLHAILSGSVPASKDSVNKLRHSHRVRDLEQVIQTYKAPQSAQTKP